MNTEEFIASGTLEAYALGTATPEEIALAEAMIRQFPEVEAEYHAIAVSIEAQAKAFAKPAPTATWATIAASLQPAAPSVGSNHTATRSVDFTASVSSNSIGTNHVPVREAKEINIFAPARPQRGGKQVFLWQWSSMALAAMLLLSLGVNFYFYQANDNLTGKLAAAERDREVIASTAAFTEKTLAETKAENEHLDGLLTQAMTPQKGIIAFDAMPAAPGAKVALSYDKKTRMVALRGSNMPPMPAGKVVQLWAIVDGKPVSLGLATRAAEGNLLMSPVPADMAEPQAFALSLETGGAHDTPEGPILAMGKVSL